MIQILVDGVTLSAHSARRGLGTYLRAVLPRLSEHPDLTVEALVAGDTQLPVGVTPVSVRRRLPPVLNFYEQGLRLSGDIRRANPDVFHSPALDPPRHCAQPWVQTLHDVTPMSFRHRDNWVRRQMWRTRGRRMRGATAVIAISRHTADDGIAHLGLDPRRIHVVHQGVDEAFHPAIDVVKADPPFLLFVSGYGAHKGFPEAVQAITALADAGLPHRLKVVGHMAGRADARVTTMLAQSDRHQRVDRLGYVSVEELRTLYQQSSAVMITSRYEGFCLPAVEAMASGASVVAFDNSALPEVIGDAGLLVPDGDVRAFVGATRRLLGDGRLQEALAEAGAARARQFSWDRSAAEHAAIFRAAASG